MQPIPFVIAGADIEFSYRQRHDHLHFQKHKLSPDAVSQAKFKRSPRVFNGVKTVVYRGNPALGKGFVGLRPIKWIKVETVVAVSEEAFLGRELTT